MPNTSYVRETQSLQRVISNPERRLVFTRHALDEMKNDEITTADVISCLTNGHVVLEERNKPEILWRVVGRDVDLRKIQVVAAVYEDVVLIKVITCFA